MSLGILYPNGHVEACLMYVWDVNLLAPVVWNGQFSGTITAAVTNDGTFATPGRQDTGNTSLASIKTNTDPLVASGAGGYVRQDSTATIAKESGGNLATIAGKDFATQTTLALIKTNTDKIPPQGQAAMAASTPVAIASNQSAVPVSLASAPTTAVTVADGANVVEGATTDAAVSTDTTGTINAKLRGLIKLLTTAGSALVTATIAAGSAVIGSVKDAGYQNSTWAVHHIPAANAQATCTQSSAGGSTKNVCLGFTATLASSSTTAPAAIQITVSLIDGASAGTTYLWRSVISLPATAGAITSFNIRANHGFVGTAATAMTLEFSAAGGANTIESVSMYGTTTT